MPRPIRPGQQAVQQFGAPDGVTVNPGDEFTVSMRMHPVRRAADDDRGRVGRVDWRTCEGRALTTNPPGGSRSAGAVNAGPTRQEHVLAQRDPRRCPAATGSGWGRCSRPRSVRRGAVGCCRVGRASVLAVAGWGGRIPRWSGESKWFPRRSGEPARGWGALWRMPDRRRSSWPSPAGRSDPAPRAPAAAR